ncbi:hypothetical protein ABIE41_003139 [Bosea sp. OAE506]|uniref:hypothetical protein n=1 Tax=Bosea sp. OAE506 TaxID=2663870 RepID=UPI0017890C15
MRNPLVVALPQAHQDFLTDLAYVLVRWNNYEAMLSLILYSIIGGGPKADVLISEMGSTAMINAINTYAADFTDPPLSDHLLHSTKYFERMREYRNYYIHGIKHIGGNGSLEAGGHIQTNSAKSRFVMHEQLVAPAEIVGFAEKIEIGRAHADQIISHLWGLQPGEAGVKPLGSLEKPSLPKRLEKPRQFLERSAPPPEPAEE